VGIVNFFFPFSSGIILKLVVFVILLIDCVVSQKLSSHFFSLTWLFESVQQQSSTLTILRLHCGEPSLTLKA